MTRYLLVSRSAEYESRLRRLLRARLQVVPGEYLALGIDKVADRVVGQPAIVMLGPLLSFDETKALVEALRGQFGEIGVVVVREQRADLEDWVVGMQIHAVLSPEASDVATSQLVDRLDDWLVSAGLAEAPETGDDPDSDAEDSVPWVKLLEPPAEEPLTEAADQATPEPAAPAIEWSLPPMEPGVRSEVIAVVAPKGGQGKTTMAVNLAVGLAEVAANSVVLVDADLQFGDVANVLDLRPAHTLTEALESVDDEVILKTRLIHHPDDFFVIAAPRSPELGDQIDAETLGRLIRRLAQLFRYVVLDTTPGLGEHVLVALENATDGVFVTTMTVPSLRALRTELETLLALDLLPQNRHLVLNGVEKHTGLTVKDASAILGAPPDVTVPRSTEVVLAANAGVALIHHDPRDAAAKAVRSLVQRIEPAAYPTRRRIHRKARRHEPE